jgi:hypothetical protein
MRVRRQLQCDDAALSDTRAQWGMRGAWYRTGLQSTGRGISSANEGRGHYFGGKSRPFFLSSAMNTVSASRAACSSSVSLMTRSDSSPTSTSAKYLDSCAWNRADRTAVAG